MSDSPSLPLRVLAASGAVFAALAVALSAYAAHATQGEAQSQLYTAAIFAFGHGIALNVLATRTPRRLGQVALAALLVGTLLFSGSLVFRQFAGHSLGLAPLGGSLMIIGWLLQAIAALRR